MSDIYNSIDLGEDFLAHYGVPGMHWGIRNNRDKVYTDAYGKTVPFNPVITSAIQIGASATAGILGYVGARALGFGGTVPGMLATIPTNIFVTNALDRAGGQKMRRLGYV